MERVSLADAKRALAFGNFLYGNPTGRSLTHIAETPFFVSSKATVGIQVADLLANIVRQLDEDNACDEFDD